MARTGGLPVLERQTNMAEAPKRNVAVPVDNSKHSKGSLSWYCRHLRQDGDVVLLIHIYTVPRFEYGHLTWPAVKTPYEDWMYDKGEFEKKADKELEWFTDKCKEHSVQYEIHKSAIYPDEDETGSVICKIAQEHNADIIVMSYRGTGTIADRGVLGTTSEYCVCNTKIPVCMLYLHD